MARRHRRHRVWTFSLAAVAAAVAALAGSAGPALALDVTRPAEVAGLAGERDGADVALSWSAVALDAAGQAETVDHYNVYRGTTPDFVPDTAGGTNRIGSVAGTSLTDPGAAAAGTDFHYLVTAVDAAGNESNARAPLVAVPPTLTGFWTDTTIEVDWSGAGPAEHVSSYRVYWGRTSGQYESVLDVGLADTHSLVGLQTLVNWYVAVTAVDLQGNESAFSNEHIDAVAGLIKMRFHDGDELCWGGGCEPADPDKVQRNGGFQLLVPGHLPEGDWVSVLLTVTIESRLCTPPAQGTVNKCADNNPCVSPPCNGNPAYNPCGDPWDRLGQVFLVLDDCIAAGGSCITPDNLEIAHFVTPFGTDAEPPDGTGFVPPRVYRVDLTPYARLLAGLDTYVGAEIVHFVQSGWWVTVDFTFNERPSSASPRPPADGVEIVGFGGAPLPPRTVSIPLEAKQVKARVFTTGHGGAYHCSAGTNIGQPCTAHVQCPGGACNPCDEFCLRTNRLRSNGTPIWSVVPWRTDCSPSANPCSNWNACGLGSCPFARAGWCPGYLACHHNGPCENDIDLTGQLPPGASYDLDYVVEPQNGSWPVSVVLYWYE
jgi:hypothetical protein